MEQDESHKVKEDYEFTEKNSEWDSNRMMGLAAIFISILSMGAVIYQSYLSREENELIRIQQSATVLPYLSFWHSDIDDKFKFVIANKGVGPAFIKEVKFIGIDSQSKDTTHFKNSHQLINFMEEKSSLLDSTPNVKSSFRSNMLLTQNEEKEIIVFYSEDSNELSLIKDEFYNHLGGLQITYEDVYGARWILDSNSDSPQKVEK